MSKNNVRYLLLLIVVVCMAIYGCGGGEFRAASDQAGGAGLREAEVVAGSGGVFIGSGGRTVTGGSGGRKMASGGGGAFGDGGANGGDGGSGGSDDVIGGAAGYTGGVAGAEGGEGGEAGGDSGGSGGSSDGGSGNSGGGGTAGATGGNGGSGQAGSGGSQGGVGGEGGAGTGGSPAVAVSKAQAVENFFLTAEGRLLPSVDPQSCHHDDIDVRDTVLCTLSNWTSADGWESDSGNQFSPDKPISALELLRGAMATYGWTPYEHDCFELYFGAWANPTVEEKLLVGALCQHEASGDWVDGRPFNLSEPISTTGDLAALISLLKDAYDADDVSRLELMELLANKVADPEYVSTAGEFAPSAGDSCDGNDFFGVDSDTFDCQVVTYIAGLDRDIMRFDPSSPFAFQSWTIDKRNLPKMLLRAAVQGFDPGTHDCLTPLQKAEFGSGNYEWDFLEFAEYACAKGIMNPTQWAGTLPRRDVVRLARKVVEMRERGEL